MLALATFLAQATGFAAMVEGPCVESCPDDDPAGHCSPLCACATCGHSVRQAVAVRVATLAAPQSRPLTFESGARLFPSPEPDEILHVPKSPLV